MTVAVSQNDIHHMRHALGLARRALGTTAENPAVGALVVANGRVVGRSWTQAGGRPHAEPGALAQAGPHTKGATMYVTLEPCSHYGKTPPCADAIIEAGIARVVIACGDPDPRVNGRGVKKLEAAGVEVSVGLMQAESEDLLRGFLMRVTHARPWITLKLAQSIDGRIATATGDSKWITDSHARMIGHQLRADADAILVGSGTVLADSPSLDCRIAGREHLSPTRVVLDRRARAHDAVQAMAAKADSQILHYVGSAYAPTQDDPPKNGEQVTYPDTLSALASDLGTRGVNRLLIEGGGQVAAAFLAADLVDEIVGFGGNPIIGGDGRPSIAALGMTVLADAPRFRLATQRHIGDQTLAYWRRER